MNQAIQNTFLYRICRLLTSKCFGVFRSDTVPDELSCLDIPKSMCHAPHI